MAAAGTCLEPNIELRVTAMVLIADAGVCLEDMD
jgi:hypothetical protein